MNCAELHRSLGNTKCEIIDACIVENILPAFAYESFEKRLIGFLSKRYNEKVMCLIYVAVDAHPNYRIVIAANRDEFYDRPTAPASFWHEAPRLLAGRDIRAGGTWLGVTRTGRMAALTNYRDQESKRAEAPSRGAMVSGFLLGKEKPGLYLEQISVNAHRYNGFNLLVGQGANFHYYSNRARGIRMLEPGIHGLSNHLLDTPWPKVEKGKQALRALLTEEILRPEDLFDFLLDRSVAPDELLPDTGVGLELERILSPVFVRSPGYGTRSSTVVLLDRTGKITFIEKSFQDGSEDPSVVQYSFMLEPDPLSEF